MRKNITMDMIATKAGVSKSTVSYVLSGKKQLSESVKAKVLSTAEELGYRPQKVAPELFLDQKLRIRLEVNQNQSTNDSAICRHEIIRGILDQLNGTNYELCLQPSPQPGKNTQASSESLKGVISVFRKKPLTVTAEDGPNQLPVVHIGHHDKEPQPFLVDADGLGAGYQAASWVIKRGADRVLFVKDQDWPLWYEQYEKGFQMACKEHEVSWGSEDFVTLDTSAEMIPVINQSRPFNAVIVPSNALANQLTYHPSCKNSNILAMKQFSGIAQSDIRNPGTEFPAYEMGKEAADMLLGIISKQRVAHNSVIISCDFNKGT